MLFKVTGLIVALVFTGYLSWFYGHRSMEKDYITVIARSELYDIGANLKLLENLREKVTDEEILIASEEIVLDKIIMFSKLNPAFSKLSGPGGRVLCKVLELNHENSLFKLSNNELVAVAKKYLKSVEEKAKNEINVVLGAGEKEDCAF